MNTSQPDLTTARSVKFAAEDADRPNGYISQSAARGKLTRSVASAASFLGGGGSAMSKSAARRRRMWRRVAMRCNPRYWVLVLDKTLPIIHPDSLGRRMWDVTILILVVYNVIMVPYEVGFSQPLPRILDPMNFGIDGLFAIDICLNYRTAYVDHTATLIRDGKKIAAHYTRTWFLVDLVATVPFDALVSAFSSNLSQTQLTALALLRTPRLLRLIRLLRFLDRMKGANYMRMIKLLFFMASVAHWVACMWHLLYKLLQSSWLDWTFDSIGSGTGELTYFLFAYLNSFLLMIGNDMQPLNDYERLYSVFVLILGACFYAIIVGNISLLVNNMNPTASRHKFKKDIVQNTIRYLGAPQPLVNRVDSYFNYLTTYSHPGPDGMGLVQQLPTSMFQDISVWMHKDLVNRVPLFKETEDAFITQLVMRLRLHVFLQGEVIFRIGDVGHEMFFITKGYVAVTNSYGEMLSMLAQGGFFGELALLATARRTAHCTALQNCDLSLLMAGDLVAAMRDFPDSAALVRSRAVNRLAELQTAGTVGEQSRQTVAPAHLRKLNPDAANNMDRSAQETEEEEEDDDDQAGGDSSQGGDESSCDEGSERPQSDEGGSWCPERAGVPDHPQVDDPCKPRHGSIKELPELLSHYPAQQTSRSGSTDQGEQGFHNVPHPPNLTQYSLHPPDPQPPAGPPPDQPGSRVLPEPATPFQPAPHPFARMPSSIQISASQTTDLLGASGLAPVEEDPAAPSSSQVHQSGSGIDPPPGNGSQGVLRSGSKMRRVPRRRSTLRSLHSTSELSDDPAPASSRPLSRSQHTSFRGPHGGGMGAGGGEGHTAAGPSRLSMGQFPALDQGPGEVPLNSSRSNEGGGRRRKLSGDVDALVAAANFQSPVEWSQATVDVLVQVMQAVGRLSMKVKDLGGQVQGMHDRMEKVDIAGQQGIGMQQGGIFGGPPAAVFQEFDLS
ncbi:hypothetical protein V8C86DRAFT_2849289 [Haematococcus lacustris]